MVDGLSSMKEVKKGFALRSDEEVRRAELYHLHSARESKDGRGFYMRGLLLSETESPAGPG